MQVVCLAATVTATVLGVTVTATVLGVAGAAQPRVLARTRWPSNRWHDRSVSDVARLETTVTLRDAPVDGRSYAVDARLDAVLDDGRRIVLLDDRGWSATAVGPVDAPGVWRRATAADFEETARVVVGPDEPAPGRTREDEDALHWAALAARLGEVGVVVDGDRLARLPHDVALDDRLLARVQH